VITISEVKTEPVRAEKTAVERLRVLVKRKYGKLKGPMGYEMTEAVKKHCEKLERELTK